MSEYNKVRTAASFQATVIAVMTILLFCVACVTADNDDNIAIAAEPQGELLFEESFEDSDFASRGWYDGPTFELSSEAQVSGEKSCVWHWMKKGDIGPAGGAARVKLPPVETVTLSYYMKHSDNWDWTGVNWHPHKFHFLTSKDSYTVGPAYTWLTFYIEVVNGVPRIAIQDSKNIDTDKLGENLVAVSENRSVAGGNGDSDGYGNLGHYRSGENYRNGKHWEADAVYFGDETGPRYKGDWHQVEVELTLNSIDEKGIGQRDGVLRYRFDGELLMDYSDVVYRTGAHPDMKINQFMMAPYYGPGVPHEQKIWVDDIKIWGE